MPQTRMFRDRVVSMEQTFEGGEKHLELLKTLCAEALPDFEYVGHFLEHERDLFVVELAARDGRKKRVGWTRMVLFDAERIPVLSGDPRDALRTKIVGYLRSRASHPEIVVTFRHLEEGWVDTPEARRDRRRRRRGGGGGGGGAGARPPPPAAGARRSGAEDRTGAPQGPARPGSGSARASRESTGLRRGPRTEGVPARRASRAGSGGAGGGAG